MTATIRRLLLLAVLVTAVGAIVAARRRDAVRPTPGAAEWPRFPDVHHRHWVTPDADGACPLDHPIKANDNSGIYHVPGGRFYERTRAERCYARAEDAESDGYRAAKA